MVTEPMVLTANPPVHHKVGTRSSVGVWSSSSESNSLFLNQLRQCDDLQFLIRATGSVQSQGQNIQIGEGLPIKEGKTLKKIPVKEYNIIIKTPGQSNQ